MAQSHEMGIYDIEDALATPATPPEIPSPCPLSSQNEDPDNSIEPPTVGSVFVGILRDPVSTFIRRWNWKAALLSSLLRATIFFFTNLIAGWHAALGAMLAFGLITQAARKRQWMVLFWATAFVVCLAALLLSNSRAPLA